MLLCALNESEKKGKGLSLVHYLVRLVILFILMGMRLFCLTVLYILEGSCIRLMVLHVLMGLPLSCLMVLCVLNDSGKKGKG